MPPKKKPSPGAQRRKKAEKKVNQLVDQGYRLNRKKASMTYLHALNRQPFGHFDAVPEMMRRTLTTGQPLGVAKQAKKVKVR